jgi:hypothetical protein
MDSLKYWLEQIEKNQDGKALTHWEINVLLDELEKWITDEQLKIKILPLLRILQDKYKNHNHKSLVAKFCLKLIDDWEQRQKLNIF